MAVHKKPTAVRLRPETHWVLEMLAQDTGLSRTGVIELAVRDLARRRRLPSRAETPAPPVAPAQRRSLLGIAAGIPGGSEEFLRHKREEKEKEDRPREAGR